MSQSGCFLLFSVAVLSAYRTAWMSVERREREVEDEPMRRAEAASRRATLPPSSSPPSSPSPPHHGATTPTHHLPNPLSRPPPPLPRNPPLRQVLPTPPLLPTLSRSPDLPRPIPAQKPLGHHRRRRSRSPIRPKLCGAPLLSPAKLTPRADDLNAPLLRLPPISTPAATEEDLSPQARAALILESEPEIRQLERELREVQLLDERGVVGAGKLGGESFQRGGGEQYRAES